MQGIAAPVNINELRQLVERKTETVKALEALLEKEESELVELEGKLESLEDEKDRQAHEPVRGA
jgi:predicted RNase H-like nuclease (RuvC/YqgF family)